MGIAESIRVRLHGALVGRIRNTRRALQAIAALPEGCQRRFLQRFARFRLGRDWVSQYLFDRLSKRLYPDQELSRMVAECFAGNDGSDGLLADGVWLPPTTDMNSGTGFPVNDLFDLIYTRICPEHIAQMLYCDGPYEFPGRFEVRPGGAS